MTETNLSNTDSETNEEVVIKIKNPRGRPINPDRHIDGKYNNKPFDPEYFKKYYYKTFRKEYCCSICGKILETTQRIKRHEQSAFCLKAKYKLENGEV